LREWSARAKSPRGEFPNFLLGIAENVALLIRGILRAERVGHRPEGPPTGTQTIPIGAWRDWLSCEKWPNEANFPEKRIFLEVFEFQGVAGIDSGFSRARAGAKRTQFVGLRR